MWLYDMQIISKLFDVVNLLENNIEKCLYTYFNEKCYEKKEKHKQN